MTSRRRGGEAEYNFWPVYSDLALSMLLIVLLFLLGQLAVNAWLEVERDDHRERVVTLQRAVRTQLYGVEGVVEIQENGNLQIVTLSADFLFPSDEARLTSEGVRLLHQLGQIFLDNQEQYTRLAVEGHADARRSRNYRRSGDLDADHGNWRLSAERAIQVVQLFQQAGINGGKLEVVGRSRYNPVDTIYLRYLDNEMDLDLPEASESLRRNRRIVVRIFYSERDDVS